MEYTNDLSYEIMRSALLPTSPEIMTVFVEAKCHMSKLMSTLNKSTSLPMSKIFPLGLIV